MNKAYLSETNFSAIVIEVDFNGETLKSYRFYDNKEIDPVVSEIEFDTEGEAYFMRQGERYDISEFMKL